MVDALKAVAPFTLSCLVVAMLWRNADFGVLLLALSQCLASPVPSDTKCYSVPESPYRFYSTPTDYEDVRGHGTDFTLSGCIPRKFYIFSRHGIRYPTSGAFAVLRHRAPQLHHMILDSLHNGTLCPHEQMALRGWTFSLDPKKAELLSDTGKKEAHDLGMRYAHRFPSLLGQPYSPERYKFQHTWKTRTRETAEAMALGMFNNSDIHMSVNPKPCDPLLKFYECCDKYQKTVKNQPFKEEEAFERGAEIHGVLHNVSRRLGLHDGAISFGDIEVMYEGCSYEQAILGSSPWCLVFSNEELLILEYWRDLKFYWGYGYGHSINYEQTCDLIKDLITYLKNSATKVTGMIRASHDSSLLPFLARLGVFRDSVSPKANNMAEQANRKWRSSKISSFNSNIAFVEYQCGSISKVRVFHNEKPLALPMCPEAGCSVLNIVNSYLGTFAEVCDFQQTCDIHHNCDGHVTHSGTCVPTIIG